MKKLRLKHTLMLLPLAACGPAGEPGDAGGTTSVEPSLPELLAALEGDFTPLGELPALRFPADHAAHPSYRTEAWIVTGLAGRGTSRLAAFQLSVFRIGLGAPPDIESDWATGDVYAAVAMLADSSGDGLRIAERVSRAAAGLAGSGLEPPSVWVEDWRLELPQPDSGRFFVDGSVALADVSIEFRGGSDVPAIVPGEVDDAARGASSPFAYYAQPRIEAQVRFAGVRSDEPTDADFVLEHAWGELPLPGSPVARDRFTLFLDDGSQLMLVRTHRVDGSGTAETEGLFVAANGDVQALDADAIEFDPTEHWRSPRTQARYPIAWRLLIPSLAVELRLEPPRRDFEGVAWTPFWMGPVDLLSLSPRSSSGPSPRSSGAGTMTLTGYGASAN